MINTVQKNDVIHDRGMKDIDSLSAISLRQAIPFWFRLGCLGFGGPAGQVAMMHEEVVEKQRWMSEQRFLHALNYCLLLPGPEAQQLATYIGWLMHRTRGGLVAGGLFVLPSLFLLIAVAWLYMVFGQSTWIIAVFYAIKPAVVAVVIQAAFRIAGRTIKNQWLLMISLFAFLSVAIWHVAFPWVVLVAALMGAVGGYLLPNAFGVDKPKALNNSLNPQVDASADLTEINQETTEEHALNELTKNDSTIQKKQGMPIWFDDQTPLPSHALFRWSRLIKVLILGGLAWLFPMILLVHWLGWQHDLTQMAYFFTTAALLPFGGAYAVLPYVYQAAVNHYHWLTASQMIDGLALGESTPGPLIMVVVFVAFLGGYQHLTVESLPPYVVGIIAALVVTWFTFLPTFVFIFAGAPVIESMRGQVQLKAPMTAISAAVVGVITSLAVFFAGHVFFPITSLEAIRSFGMIWQLLDKLSAMLFLLALLFLFQFKQSVLRVMIGAAVIGLVLKGGGFM